MDSHRWQVITDLFDAVVEYPVTERRALLVELSAGDGELQREIERLLAADEDATSGKFLEPSVATQEATRQSADNADVTDWRIGRYTVEKRIGQGGMGEVFLAARVEDYRQHVAIKVIRPGLHAEHLVRRFRDELQILAALGQHANIASLMDAGTFEDGRPYYVMEYVAGQRIDRYCSDQRLTTAQRVELFRQVCSAVQFAHQHGVIHRDLKPGNILVTADGAPKLIDFGIAKLTSVETNETDCVDEDGDENDDTETNGSKTITRQLAMTPDYASPEQVRGDAVTTASDVYSLGVVLHELLVGRRPNDSDGRILAAKQPPDDASNDHDRVVAPAQTPPTLPRRRLASDLDAVVCMALRTAPEQRYASAEHLSADLQRFLEGRPVQARSDSVVYRVRRFIGRYRVALAAAVLLMASLTAAIVGTTRGLIAAREANEKSQRSLSQALEAVRRMLTRVGSDRLAHVPQTGPMRREILEDALKFCQAFVADHADNPEALSDLGQVYYFLGAINREMGRHDESRAAFDRAIGVFDDLSRRATKGSIDEVNKELALACYHASAGRRDVGRFEESARLLRRAVAIQSDLYEANPADLDLLHPLLQSLNNLSVAQLDLNQLGAAQATLDRVLRQLPPLEAAANADYQETAAFSHNNVGFLLRRRKQYAAAEEPYEKARALRKTLAERFPEQPSYRKEWAFSCNNLGVLFGELGENEKSLAAYQEGIALQRQLADDFPSFPVYRQELARTLANAAMQYHDLDRNGESQAAFDEALELQATLAEEHPDVPAYREEYARTLCRLADSYAAQGEHSEADELRTKAFEADPNNPTVRIFRGKSLARAEQWEQAVEEFSAALRSQPGQADIHDRRGSALRALGKHEDAIADFTRAIELSPKDAPYYRHRGSALRDLGRLREAIADYDRAIVLLPEYSVAINSRGLAYAQLREFDRAAADFTKALDLDPDDEVTVLMNRARTHASNRDWSAAIADYQRILDERADYATAWHELAVAHWCAGDDETYRTACGSLLKLARVSTEHRPLALWTTVIVPRPPVNSADLVVQIRDVLGGEETADAIATPKHHVVVGAAWLRAGNRDEAAKALTASLLAFEMNHAAEVWDDMRINALVLLTMASSAPGNTSDVEAKLGEAEAEFRRAVSQTVGAAMGNSAFEISHWADLEICARLIDEAKGIRVNAPSPPH
jgi:eukaryotic-like serine/threonine-protein kinase